MTYDLRPTTYDSRLAVRLPFEPGVLPGDRILDRLEVGEDGAVGHRFAHLLLQLLEQVVSPLHRPVPRNQHMEIDEVPGAGLAGAERVEAHAGGGVAGQDVG